MKREAGGIRVLHVVASLAESSGGPPRSVVALCHSLAALGCDVGILTLETDRWLGPPVPVPACVRVERCPCFISRRFRLAFPFGFMSKLSQYDAITDIVHSHGLWLPVNKDVARWANRAGIPHVISPRGNLHPACLGRSALKKRLARISFVDRALEEASCIHATAEDEGRHVRDFTSSVPLAVIPTGVSRPDASEADLKLRFNEKWPVFRGRRIVLYLGRLHPHKGVLDLARAWGRLAGEFSGWDLIFAGGDEVGCLSEIEAILRTSGAMPRTFFTGPVVGLDKWALLSNSDFLALPTYSENFGIVIAEALCVGTPVLTTNTTPWKDLQGMDCGWQIPVGLAALQAALSEILALPCGRLSQMRAAAGTFVRSKFDPKVTAEQMLAMYTWLLRIAPQPACVKVA